LAWVGSVGSVAGGVQGLDKGDSVFVEVLVRLLLVLVVLVGLARNSSNK
jgi:hypothetical protein